MNPRFIISIILLGLTSCEGFIHMQGRVFDESTKRPLDQVQVLLILRGKDTILSNKLEYDTITYNERIALRKKGISDNYEMHDPVGFSKRIPSQTDSMGYFSVGNMLVGCVPRCPKCELVFTKTGYNPVRLKLNSIVADSLIVILKKL